MKKINLTDYEFFKTKSRELSELADAFEKAAEDIVTRNEYYEKKEFKDSIAMRQDCYAVSRSLLAAHSAMLNILNQSANIPSNIKKMKEQKCQKK